MISSRVHSSAGTPRAPYPPEAEPTIVVLRFNEDDVEEFGLLSGYLHDAIGSWDETSFDRDAGTFRIDVDRPRRYPTALG